MKTPKGKASLGSGRAHHAKWTCLLRMMEVIPATPMSRAISITEMKTRYWGDSSVLVLGRVLVMVNCTTKVGNRTEMRVFRRSGKLSWGMKKQAKPMRVKMMGGTIVCRLKNSLHTEV